jgi:hypothetical protein
MSQGVWFDEMRAFLFVTAALLATDAMMQRS